ncbi:MAG: hypothetical protein U5K54_16075 [Cytophagales bacterium]|nr:hypothetical protein [Cytophagales bacterium]
MNFGKEIKGNSLVLRISGDLIGEDNGTQLLQAVKRCHQSKQANIVYYRHF